MARKRHKVVLCGHYGSTNIGDEAIGLSIVQKLIKIHPDSKIVILSYDPKRTRNFYKKHLPGKHISSVYLLPMGIRSLFRGIFKGELWHTLKQIRNCDKFILGGGGLFTDERLFAVFLWGIHAFFAYKYKKPVYMIGQSVGPLNTKIGKWITKKVFSKASGIILRDKASKEVLTKIGVDSLINVSTDPAIGLKIDKKNELFEIGEKLNNNLEQKGYKGYFIYSIRPWTKKFEYMYKNIIQTVQLISEKYKLVPVFIPFQLIKENDIKILNKIVEQNRVKAKIMPIKHTDDLFHILGIISGAKFTLGVRLHSLIFSYITRTPFIGIVYSSKVRNFMSEVDLSEYMVNADIKIMKKNKQLMNKIDELIKNRDNIRKKIDNSLKLKIQDWDKIIL